MPTAAQEIAFPVDLDYGPQGTAFPVDRQGLQAPTVGGRTSGSVDAVRPLAAGPDTVVASVNSLGVGGRMT